LRCAISGELTLSQFRWTTTNSDDFVIGNPSDTSTNTKYLVFQTTTTPGYAANPHLSLQWNNTSSAWNFHLNDLSGSGDINLSGAVNTYSNNTFYGTNLFTQATTTSITYTPVSLATGGNTQFATTKFVTDEINYLLVHPNGLAGTDSSGKIPLSLMPAGVTGSLNYQGTWNAATNTPALASGVGTKGYYYKVSTAGSTSLDGISNWLVGDDVVFDGTTWDKINGSATEVTSVNTFTGAVTLTTASIPESGSLYFLNSDRLGATVISFYTYPSSNLGPLANTDTFSTALSKIQYQLNSGVSSYNSLTTGLGGQSIASYVTAYTTSIATNYATASEFTTLNSQVSTLTGSGSITSISTYVSGAITTAGAGYATASEFTTLNSQVSTLTGSGSITSISTYVSGAITTAGAGYATASEFSTLNSTVTTLTGTGPGSIQSIADARISNWQTTYADTTYATASTVSGLSSTLTTLTGSGAGSISSTVNAGINSAFTTYVSNNVAIADTINALGTTLGMQNSSVAVSQTSTNGSSATYGIVLGAGTHGQAGFALSVGDQSAASATIAIVPYTGQANTVIISNLPANSKPNQSYTVSVPTGHAAYFWAVSGGYVVGSNTSNTVTFNCGPGGTITIACKMTDSTTDSTGATIPVVTNAVGSVSVVAPPASGSNVTYPVIENTLYSNVGPGTTGLTATIDPTSLITGHSYTYSWTISNGTITSGTTGSSITFNVGSTGPLCTITCTLTDTSIPINYSAISFDASNFNLVDPTTGTPYFSYSGGALTFTGTTTFVGSVSISDLTVGTLNANMTLGSGLIQVGYTENTSHYPTAGVQLSAVSTPIKVGPGGMMIGSNGYLLDQVTMGALNLLDNNGAIDNTFTGWYKGNVNTAVRGGAPNIACLWIQNTFSEWTNNEMTDMWNYRIVGTSTSSANGNNDNIDALTHMEVQVYDGGSHYLRMVVYVAMAGRNYYNRASNAHGTNGYADVVDSARSNMTIKYRYGLADQAATANGTSYGPFLTGQDYYAKCYLYIRLWNAYGPSDWSWYAPADLGIWNNGGATGPTVSYGNVLNGGPAPSSYMDSIGTVAYGGNTTSSGGGGGNAGFVCPAPWTFIDTIEGQIMAKDIKPGMVVFTQHELTEQYGNYIIGAVSFGINDIWTLLLEDGRELDFAPNHRFLTTSGWQELKILKPGMTILGSTPGIVKSVQEKLLNTEVIKITVNDAHTYQTSGLISHNIKTLS